mmetsp:Transcript_168702/g.542127  ORF Transcript_168702/g.542127 Transcript_168702/m.542127 type:complete len:205 (-) Transcript_168702:4-618(-)
MRNLKPRPSLGVHPPHDGGDKFTFFQQVSSIVALSRDALGASQIDVHCVTLRLDILGSLCHGFRVVAAELYNQGSVLGASGEVLLPVLRVFGEVAAVHHGGVGQLATVSPGQHPECELRLVHHRSTDGLRRADGPEKLEAPQLRPLPLGRRLVLVPSAFRILVPRLILAPDIVVCSCPSLGHRGPTLAKRHRGRALARARIWST